MQLGESKPPCGFGHISPDVKSQLTGKDPDAGQGWGQEKGVTEDEMIGWRHWLNGHEFEQTPDDSEEKWSLAWWSPRDCKKSDTTEWLSDNNMDLQFVSSLQSLSDIFENSSMGMTCVSSFSVLSPLLRTKSTSWIKAYALIRSSSDSYTRESLRGTALGNGSQTWLHKESP